MLDVKL
jgi:hypothetical protein